MSDECMPSLSSLRDTCTPGSDVSTRNSETPWWPAPGSVLATRVRNCARVPLVMNILRPLTRHASPSRTACVRIAATSEPASGSVIAIAPIFVPAIAGRSQRSRWSSVPNSPSAGVAMCVCTEIAIGMAPAPQRASSSTKTRPAARSPPLPPHRTGKCRPRKPSSPHRRNRSSGKWRAVSHASTWGRTSDSTNRRTVPRSSSCSAVKIGWRIIATNAATPPRGP